MLPGASRHTADPAPAKRASAGRPPRLRSGGPAAPAARCLPLLPSGPGGVHRATMRETRSSTPREPSGAQVIGGVSRPKLRISPRAAPAGRGASTTRPRSVDVTPHRVSRQSCRVDSCEPDGGEAGIRTRGGVTPTHALQACSFNRSDTSPHARQETHRGQAARSSPPFLAGRDSSHGGEGGIRTHVGVAPQPAFEAGPLRPLRYLSSVERTPRPTANTPRALPACAGGSPLWHALDQDNPIAGVVKRLHVRKLAEQPAVEDLLVPVPDRHQRCRVPGLVRRRRDLVVFDL